MTTKLTAVSSTDTESIAPTFAPVPAYKPYTQLKKSDVLRLLNMNLTSNELWPWLRECGVTVRGITHNYVSYGDLMKAGVIDEQ